MDELAEREAFGLEQADAPVSLGDQLTEASVATESQLVADVAGAESADGVFEFKSPTSAAELNGSEPPAGNEIGSEAGSETSAEPTGKAMAPWTWPPTMASGAAMPRPATTRAVTTKPPAPPIWPMPMSACTTTSHQQALGLRISQAEQAALYLLIESLNEDGYLEESLEELAAAVLPGDETAQPELLLRREELIHHLRVALGLLQHGPTGVGARDLAECLRLQVEELRNTLVAQAALAMCRQPLELLARRDSKTGAAVRQGRTADPRTLALIARLEPKPGRRFADVERNVVVPDVIVTPCRRG